MKAQELRQLYVRDLAKSPEILAAIRRAAGSDDRTVTLDFESFSDDPIRLYAACALAHADGVAVLFPA